jgi:hypothetical protein
MLSNQMMKLAKQNQWKVNAQEELIFGDYNGYRFTLLEGNHFKAFITPIAGIHPDALDAIFSFLENESHALKIRNYEATDNFLCVRLNEGVLKLSLEKMESFLGHLSGLLSLYEVPADACVVCGKPAKRRGLYFGLYCCLHPECENRDLVDFTGHVDKLKNGSADDTKSAGNTDVEQTEDTLSDNDGDDPFQNAENNQPPPATQKEPADPSQRM